MKKNTIYALLAIFVIAVTWFVQPSNNKNSTYKVVKLNDSGSTFSAEEREAISTTLKHIDDGTVPSGAISRKWGSKFSNYERRLPSNASYQEYRVSPPPGAQGAGTRRIVVGSDGAVYYTNDHYESFGRIR